MFNYCSVISTQVISTAFLLMAKHLPTGSEDNICQACYTGTLSSYFTSEV
ncbi:hypothetical protein DsansV1_C07g0072131 [Dioscorea sansibarensis]